MKPKTPKKKTIPTNYDWRAFVRCERKLRNRLDAESCKRGVIGFGDTLDVDYFALTDLLDFVENVRHDMEALELIRGIMGRMHTR